MDVMNSTDYVTEIENARKELRDLISSNNCAPIMLRLAWNDAATYDIRDGSGGPNGSIRFPREYSHYANHGLKTAIDLCQIVKSQHPMISYADLYQLAGVVAVEVTGGPRIDFVHGRKDSNICTSEGRLPDPNEDQDHLRSVFYRMGFSDKEIVALSGAHTLGRAHHERSGFEGPWTSEPLKFDNSYFVELRKLVGEGLVKLPTDMSLVRDPALRKHALAYAEDQEAFFRDYAAAHKKFSELGMGASTISKLMQNVTGVAFGVTIGVSLVAVMIVVSCLNGGRRRH